MSENQKKNATSVSVIDVAKMANVSIATVSRSFNKPEMVKPEVRERILKIASEMGYTANSAAKSLRSKKTHIIGAIIPTLDYAIFATMMNAFQKKLSEHGYVVYIVTCGFNASDIFEKVTLLLERGAEALLVVGKILDENLATHLLRFNIPTICTYSFHHDSTFPFIGFDNYVATQSILDYLFALGHTHITMICGPLTGNDRQIARLEAFKNYMMDKNANYNIVECTEYSILSGKNAFKTSIKDTVGTTAIICNSDVIAFGVLVGAKELNINIPADISVVGYDNFEFASYLTPPLTTLSIPAEEMGYLSAISLLDNLQHQKPLSSKLLKTQLITRDSVKSVF